MMEGGILVLEDGFCVCNLVREEMVKPGGGLLNDIHNMVVTLGHRGRSLNSEGERPDRFVAIGVPSSPDRP